jgi:chromosomal replication initiation ATPase DnaA
MVCEKWAITEEQLRGGSRLNVFVMARREIAHILREEYHLSYQSISAILGKKDHTTAMHYFKNKDGKVKNEE